MNCPYCATENPRNANFCYHCGQVLAESCRQCSTPLMPGAKYCYHCGYPVAEMASVDPSQYRPEMQERPHERTPAAPRRQAIAHQPGADSLVNKFLPRDLAAKLESARAGEEMVGERRVVTMLFCDVKGSTAAAEQLDPEDWTEIINGAFEHMITPVYKYEGTVARLMGDAILAFFGAPIAHEDDPQRAVLAGLEITEGIEPFRRHIQERWGLDINVRVGINTGRVIVGAVGSDLRMEYTAMGDAINLAARMEQTAVPGSVQIAENTYRMVVDYFEFEPLGGIIIAGKNDPVLAYRVLGHHQGRDREKRLGRQIALIGSFQEWNQLRQCAQDLITGGQGAVVFLIAEAGLGKTRLFQELHTALEGQVTWFETASLSFESGKSYALFQHWIRFLAGVGPNDEQATVHECLDRLVADWPEEEQALTHQVLATLLGVKPGAGSPPLEGETFKGRLYVTVERLVRREAARKALIFAVDDLHWADPASVALLQHLLPIAGELPLIFLGAIRPDRHTPAWEILDPAAVENGQAALAIELKSLTDSESAQLVERLLNNAAVPSKVERWILEKAEGNPLYVQEVVRALLDAGLIRHGDQGLIWPASADLAFALPDNIQALLVSRIDRLEEEPRRTLQIAALIGRYFNFHILSAIAGRGQSDLHADLQALQEADFIMLSAQAPELEYRFRQPLTQEAAYKTILRKDRRAFHHRVGLAMESLFAGQLEEFSPVIADHFHEAGDDDKAYTYYILAGQKAFRLYDLSNAFTAFDAALAAYKRLPPTAVMDEAGLLTLYRRRGRVLELVLNFDEAMANYAEMEQLADHLNNAAFKIGAWLAKATIMSTFTPVRDTIEAVRLSEQVVVLARRLQDPLAEAAGLWNLLLALSFSNDPSRSLTAGEEAREAGEAAREIVEKGALAQNEDDEVVELRAKIYNDLSRILLFNGRIDEALPANARAEEIYEQRGNIPLLASSLINASVIYFQLADYPMARAKLEKAVQISQAIGNIGGQVGPLFVKGASLFEEGRLGRCIEFLEEALILIKQVGHMGEILTCSIYLGQAYVLLGDVDRAFALGQQSLEAARKIEYSEDFALGGNVQLHLMAGDITGAESAFNSQKIELRLVNWMFSIVMYLQAKAGLEFAKGQNGEALKTLEILLGRMRITKTRNFLPTILLLQARVLKAFGRQEEAVLALQKGLDAALDTGARISLWEIYAELADLAADPAEAARLAEEARAVLLAIAHEINDPDQRQAYLQREGARRLLDNRSGKNMVINNDGTH